MTASTELVQRSSLRTSDLDEARTLVDQMYEVSSRFTAPPETRSDLAVSYTQTANFTIADQRLPGVLQVAMHGEDSVVFSTLIRGTCVMQRGHDTDRYQIGEPFITVAPDGDWQAVCEHIHSHTVILPISLLTDTAYAPDDASPQPWSFSAFTPVTGGATSWRQATRYVTDLLAVPETVSALTIGAAGRLLAATALSVFPNSAVAQTTQHDSRDAHTGALRRAIAFIEANPDLDITVRDISRAAYVTPRTIQLAFRRHLDTTPMRYLRRTRLALARADLQAAGTGDGATVTSIATRRGYSDLSRFAADYRAAYSEHPHVTLRRLNGR